MLSKILNIGIDDSLDLEDVAKVKLQNGIAVISLLINYFFIFYHLFFSHKTDVAFILFCLSFIVPLVSVFNYYKKYTLAKFTLFLFLYMLIFAVSTILLVGHGNEYYYIALSILILVLNKNHYLTALLLIVNICLYLLPHFYYPEIQEEYFVSTHIAVFISVLLTVIFFINIQHKYKAKLKEQKVVLETLNNEKNDIMSVVAHDLKSPLSQIQGLINILKIDDDKLNNEQLELIEKIKQVADTQHHQITSYLNVKALEDSIEKLELEEVSVTKTIKLALDESLTFAASKNIQIIDNSASEEVSIIGSEKGLFKVIANLISNAIKFSFPNTKIRLDVQLTKKMVLITIQDQGQGFSKNDMEFVFQKNKVLSAKPTANESSSGVGLYIVKKYVERMHGQVWLKSKKDEGTTFFINLPRG